MTDQPPHTPQAKAPIEGPIEAEIVETEPLKPAPFVKETPKRKWWQVWKRREKKPKRALLIRLFGIGIWGAIKLAILCIIVGFVMLTMQFDPSSPNFDAPKAISLFFKNVWATAKWAVTNFWNPALTGALLVLPIWVLWRLVTLPFRR